MPELLEQEKPVEKPVNTADFYQLIRQQIDGENSLMNQRVNWLLVSQSFFVSAFASLVTSPPDSEPNFYNQLQSRLIWIIPGISLVVSLFIYIGILASLMYMGNLRKSYQTYPQDSSVEHYPPIQRTTVARLLAQIPPAFVPLLFIGIWIYLLMEVVQ